MQPGAHGRVWRSNQYSEHVTIVRAKHWQSISNSEAVYPIMAHSPMPTLSQHLSQLEMHGLIRLAAAQPELESLFRHALVQEAAYASLVKFDRIDLHRAVGEVLERLYPDRTEELAPVLAKHFYEGGETHRA